MVSGSRSVPHSRSLTGVVAPNPYRKVTPPESDNLRSMTDLGTPANRLEVDDQEEDEGDEALLSYVAFSKSPPAADVVQKKKM